MKNTFKFLTIVSLLLASTIVSAQSSESENFKKFISQTFEKDLANLDHGNNIAPFLRAFSDDLIWTDAVVSTNGKVDESNRGKKYMRKKLLLSSKTPALFVKWEIIKYDELKVRKNTIIATLRAKTSLYVGDDMVSTGKNFVRIIATPLNDSYLISYLSILEVMDEVYIGPCYVNIQEGNNNSYSVSTYLPDGTNYDIQENEITFIKLDLGEAIQIKDGEKYFWNPKMSSISKTQLGGPKLAKASTKEQVIMQVIKLENTPTCKEMVQSSTVIE